MVIEKIKHVTERMATEVPKLPLYVSAYGLMSGLMIEYDRIFLRPKSKAYRKAIYRSTEKILKPVLEDNSKIKITPKKKLEKIPVWVCWYQGEDKMPELVKMCFCQLQRMVPDSAEVHLITLKNYQEYVDIPQALIEKFERNIISYAFFSDILRYFLVLNYGGMWIDSTIYVSSPILEEQLNAQYYTMKMHRELCPHEACEGLWTNFCFAAQAGSELCAFVCKALCFFGGKNYPIPDYVFLDYILMAGYNNNPAIKYLVDDVHYNNEYVWVLKDVLEEVWNEKKYLDITKNNMFHKLAHQVLYRKEVNSEKTFYGVLCKNSTC